MTGLRRLSWLLIVLVPAVLAHPAPALAHGGKGPLIASDRQAVVRSITPPVAGLAVAVLDGDTRVWLHAPPTGDVIVVGFAGEPFLRVGAGGVEVNDRSPQAHALSLARRAVAIELDPAAVPAWRRIGDGPIAVWHEHRLAPPIPAGKRDVAFTIPLLVAGRRVTVAGVERRGTRPPLLLLLVVIAALAALGAVVPAALRRGFATTAGSVAAAATVAVAASASIAGPRSETAVVVAAATTALAGAGPLLLALALPSRSALVGAAAGATSAFLGAGGSLALARPFANSALPSPVVRALVVVAIGGGVAAAIGGGRTLPWRRWWSNG